MSNTRGNKFSRQHVYLDPDVHEEFWEFSFDEMAKYDVPAAIKMVLNKTGVNNLTYIGHS